MLLAGKCPHVCVAPFEAVFFSVVDVNMDKFVAKESSTSTKKNAHLPAKINAKDRARQYANGTFHADNELMFCSSCNIVRYFISQKKRGGS